jgi:hypothetical protein
VERQHVLGIDRAGVSVMRLFCFGNESRGAPKRLRDNRSLRQQTLVSPKMGEGQICEMRGQTVAQRMNWGTLEGYPVWLLRALTVQ